MLRAEVFTSIWVAQDGLAVRISESFKEVLGKILPDSKIAQRWKCSRTKTTVLITKVIGPYLMEELAKLLKNSFFSLLVDESTDITKSSNMAIVVKLLHPETGKVIWKRVPIMLHCCCI